MRRILNRILKKLPIATERFETYQEKVDDELKKIDNLLERLSESIAEQLKTQEELIGSNAELNRQIKEICEHNSKQLLEINEKNYYILNRARTIQDNSEFCLNRIKSIQETNEYCLKRIKNIQDNNEFCLKRIRTIQDNILGNNLIQVKALTREAVWSSVFHDTIKESKWLKNRKFSPGRWAVGYAYLYVLYRILDEFKPKNILETGLGQSTQMITQYALSDKLVNKHYVVEHDPQWIEFFCNSNKISDNTVILQMPLKQKEIANSNIIDVYDGFIEKLQGKKFDLISIDAPFGGTDNEYSRIDVLNILPECLSDEFIILLDDYNRNGEKNTAELIKSKLAEANVSYSCGIYRGEKDVFILTSKAMNFFCTM